MANSLKRYQNGLASFLNRTSSSYYTGLDRSNKGSCINSAETGRSSFGQWWEGVADAPSVPGWETSATIVMDNDETDAQGRAARWRTGSSLSDSACPYAHRSLWDSHPSLFSTVCPGGRKGTAAPSPMSSSAFFHPYYCAPEPFLPWIPLPTPRVTPDWSGGTADTVVRDPNGQLAPTEALWEGDFKSKEAPFSI